LFTKAPSNGLTDALLELDAAVLAAYELPAKIERELLAHFADAARPVAGEFSGYPTQEGMARTLQELLHSRFDKMRGDWVREVFQPLPVEEASALTAALG
jgi:hypothetical protein